MEPVEENHEVVLLDGNTKKYLDITVQKLVKEELENMHETIAKTTELKLNELEVRRAKASTDASHELKRYIEWEISNGVDELKREFKKLLDDTKEGMTTFVQLSSDLKKCVETESENTINTFKDNTQQICQRFTETADELRKCLGESSDPNKGLKSEKSELTTIFEHPGRITPSRGNLLTTIEKLGKEYHVHFSFTPGNTNTGCRNILHMTANANNESYGDCIPSVSFLSAKKCFCITSAINGEVNHKQNTTTSLPLENTYVLDILQKHNEGKYYTYKIFLNDILIYAVLNYDAQDFSSVKVFVSDPYTNEQPGFMENLIIRTKVSDREATFRLSDDAK